MRLILLTAALLLAACGQKGALYHPIPGEAQPEGFCRICPPMVMPAPVDEADAPRKESRKSKKQQTAPSPASEAPSTQQEPSE